MKMACQEIEHDIKKDVRYLKKSVEKERDRSSSAKKLPKIEEFSSIKLKRNKERAKNADYHQSISHVLRDIFSSITVSYTHLTLPTIYSV